MYEQIHGISVSPNRTLRVPQRGTRNADGLRPVDRPHQALHSLLRLRVIAGAVRVNNKKIRLKTIRPKALYSLTCWLIMAKEVKCKECKKEYKAIKTDWADNPWFPKTWFLQNCSCKEL